MFEHVEHGVPLGFVISISPSPSRRPGGTVIMDDMYHYVEVGGPCSNAPHLSYLRLRACMAPPMLHG